MVKMTDEVRVCDCCHNRTAKLVNNKVVYGSSYGSWPFAWYCEECEAAVGCHRNTFKPIGKLATKETRHLRAKAHGVFDKMWRSAAKSRGQAYAWLSDKLNIPAEQCHMGMLSDENLYRVIALESDVNEIVREVALLEQKRANDERAARIKEREQRDRDSQFKRQRRKSARRKR